MSEKTNINVADELRWNLCSFDVAKKAHEAGWPVSNTFYAYNEKGELNDGAWMHKEENIKMIREKTKKPDWQPPLMYPAIDLAHALGLLEWCDIEIKKEGIYEFNDKFFFKYKGDTLQSEKLVDLAVLIWIKYKRKDKPQSGGMSGDISGLENLN